MLVRIVERSIKLCDFYLQINLLKLKLDSNYELTVIFVPSNWHFLVYFNTLEFITELFNNITEILNNLNELFIIQMLSLKDYKLVFSSNLRF